MDERRDEPKRMKEGDESGSACLTETRVRISVLHAYLLSSCFFHSEEVSNGQQRDAKYRGCAGSSDSAHDVGRTPIRTTHLCKYS